MAVLKSRIRWRGQQLIELTDGNGRSCSLVAQEMIEGQCSTCGGRFWVVSHIGDLRCPHCGGHEVHWCWGQLQIAFIPEKGGQFFNP